MRKFNSELEKNMTKHTFNKTTVAISIAMILTSGFTSAQQIDDKTVETEPQARKFEVIEVRAQKRTQNINSVGVSVSAFSEKQLEALGIDEATDVLNFTPGATMTETGVTGVPVYTIRGVGFDDYNTNSSSTVGINVDDVAVPYPTMTRGPQFDMSNVEILKGPQGTLYGLNTTGGAINFYTNAPIDSLEAGIKVRINSDSVFGTEGFITGNIVEDLDGRFAYFIEKGSKGWQDNAAVNGEGQTNGEIDKVAFRVKFNWLLSDELDAAIKLNYYDDQSDNFVPQYLTFLPVVPAFDESQAAINDYIKQQITDAGVPDTNNPNSASWNPEGNGGRDNQGLEASLKLNFYMDDMTLTSISAINNFERNEANEWDGVAVSNFDQHNISDIEAFSQELRLTSEWDNGFNWIAGLYYAKDTVKEDSTGRGPYSTAGLFVLPEWLPGFGFPEGEYTIEDVQDIGLAFDRFSTQYKQKSTTKALFLHTEYDVTEDVQLTFGLRYTKDEREIIDSCTYDVDGTLSGFFMWGLFEGTVPYEQGDCVSINPATFTSEPFNKTLSTSNTSGKLGLNWAVSDDVFLYGNVSTGYKSGGFGAPAASTWDSLESYENEEVISYELGIKSSLFDRAVQFNAAIFRYDYDNKQVSAFVSDPVFGTLTKIINAPKSEINGAEMEVNWYPSDGAVVRFTSSFLDTEYIEFESLTFGSDVVKNLAGERLQNTPEWQHNFLMHKDIELNEDMYMFVGGDINYSSEYNALVGNDPRFIIDSYTSVNLRTGIASTDDSWQISFWLNNALDKEYATSRVAANDSTSNILARERRFGLTFTYNWSE